MIKGVAMNNDGARKVSFTTTSLHGQQRLLRQAMDDARLTPEDFRAIEAHGTGTLAGDPIEFEALNGVFREHTTRRGSAPSAQSRLTSGTWKPAPAWRD